MKSSEAISIIDRLLFCIPKIKSNIIESMEMISGCPPGELDPLDFQVLSDLHPELFGGGIQILEVTQRLHAKVEKTGVLEPGDFCNLAFLCSRSQAISVSWPIFSGDLPVGFPYFSLEFLVKWDEEESLSVDH